MNHLQQEKRPDASQQRVIEAQDGCHLVLAPPGCGKTQILTERIRHAHDRGVAYGDMLCLTFTNRAARGMSERIREHLGVDGVEDVYVGNVHRYCARFLFEHALVSAGSSVIDEEDAVSIMADLLQEDPYTVMASGRRRREYAEVFHLSAFMHQITHAHPRTLRIHPECISHQDVFALKRICEVQRMAFTPQAMTDIYEHTDFYRDASQMEGYDYSSRQMIGMLLRKMSLAWQYERYKRQNHLLDFEDLLLLTYDALRGDTAQQYKRYPWIQVDEVQDLNALQLAIIDEVTAGPSSTVMYLGDEQQAIFSFMGAKTEQLGQLKSRCEGRLHHLHTNHRSPGYLLDVFNDYAAQVLKIDKALLPRTNADVTVQGDELQLMCSETYDTEVRDVVQFVARISHAHPTDTTAVIVVANRDADVVSAELSRCRLGHFKVSGDDLFATADMRLLLAHLNILGNEQSFIAWAHLLRGLHVFESDAAARNFVRASMDHAILMTDYLRDDGRTYLQDFVETCQNRDIVVFDTETTGLNVFEDDIVQIAAVRMRGGCRVEGSEFSVYIRTDREVPRKLGDVDNPVIEAMRRNELHAPADALQHFLDYVGDAVLLAHNADYDYHILDHNLHRYLPSVSLADLHPSYFDSLRLVRLLEPSLHEHKLKHLLTALGLEGENSHLADDDVAATVNVVRHCYAKAVRLLPDQQNFMSQRRVVARADALRRHYVPYHRHAVERLYLREHTASGMRPALVDEMMYFYEHLLADGIVQPISGIDYVEAYLTHDLIHAEHTPSLSEQLSHHVVELNTLKEADLCNSHSLNERIFVTTVHKAKGLEFDNVIIFDAIDGRYPGFFSQNNPHLQAEDARKFYVAMTRARHRLIVAQSLMRIDYHHQPHPCQLTRFMTPILHHFNGRQ